MGRVAARSYRRDHRRSLGAPAKGEVREGGYVIGFDLFSLPLHLRTEEPKPNCARNRQPARPIHLPQIPACQSAASLTKFASRQTPAQLKPVENTNHVRPQ